MSACCEPPPPPGLQGYDRVFDDRMARHDAARYRRSGLSWDPRRVVELYRAGVVRGETLLEVGAGIGDLTVELLRAGMRRSECVELSGAYDGVAAGLLAEHGLADRCVRRAGDFAARPGLTGPADVVVLLKVLCCYPDAPRLLAAAAAKARRHVVISYPRDAWWVRAGAAVCAFYPRLRRSDWRFVVHPPAEIRGALADAGLTRVRTESRGVWVLEVHERVPVAADGAGGARDATGAAVVGN